MGQYEERRLLAREPQELPLLLIRGGEFGYETVNVAAQQRDPGSMLNWLDLMMCQRTRSPEFGDAACEWLDTRISAVLAHCCSRGAVERGCGEQPQWEGAER